MTVLQDIVRGAQASVTLDNINLSQDYTGSGPGSTHTGSRSIGLVGNKSATYEQIYREQLWVNSIVNKLSRGIGRLPLKTYSGPGAERERRRDGPLYDLMSAPEEDVSPFHFKSAIVGNVGVHGNCVGVKVRPGAREQSRGRTPVGLSTSSWRYWSVVEGKDQRADWYVFTKAGIRIPFLPEEVVHFRFWGTGADIVGPSSISRRSRNGEDSRDLDRDDRPEGAQEGDEGDRGQAVPLSPARPGGPGRGSRLCDRRSSDRRIASASKFVKVRGKGAAISALIHVNHPGAKSAEFGRKFYYRGFTGRDQKATGQRFKPAGGQKAKPFAGIIKGDQAIGSVRNDARQRIGKAIEQEFRRVALGGLN